MSSEQPVDAPSGHKGQTPRALFKYIFGLVCLVIVLLIVFWAVRTSQRITNARQSSEMAAIQTSVGTDLGLPFSDTITTVFYSSQGPYFADSELHIQFSSRSQSEVSTTVSNWLRSRGFEVKAEADAPCIWVGSREERDIRTRVIVTSPVSTCEREHNRLRVVIKLERQGR